MSDFYVYVHERQAGRPFYVGKGRGRRAYERSRNRYWRRVVAKGGGFQVRFLARDLDEEFALLIEVEAIDQLRRCGVRLTNLTDGGEGVPGLVVSAATRAKQRAAKLGRKLSPEMCRAIAERVREDIRRAGGRKPTRSMKGFRHTTESRAKMSVAARRRAPPTAETRRLLSIAAARSSGTRGKKLGPYTAERRAKIAAAARAREARRRAERSE